MWDLMSYLIWMVALIIGVFVIGYGIKFAVSGGMKMPAMLKPTRERRLDVVDHANVDGKRRLLLVRRDNVEHLIMTGGPVDLVIETGIGAPLAVQRDVVRQKPVERTPEQASQPVQPLAANEPVFSRPARAFSKVVGEN